MDILLLLLGIAFAVYGAQLLVDGGSAIAKRFNIPSLVIGSTIVAFGTSMPEFTVNINSALQGNTDLALGNILRSNLFNICAIVGISVTDHADECQSKRGIPRSADVFNLGGGDLYLR